MSDISDLANALEAVMENPMDQFPAYRARLIVYEHLLSNGLPKCVATNIIGKLTIEVIPEAIEDPEFMNLVDTYCKFIVKIYTQMNKDFGDSSVFHDLVNQFEFKLA